MRKFRSVWRQPNNFTKEEIAERITKAVKELAASDLGGCYAYDLDIIDHYFYAIVLGWTLCDDPDEPRDDYYRNEQRITLRIGRCPTDSGMWCDLDFDWTLPVINEDGDVWDTDIQIYPDTNIDKELDWLFEQWKRMREFFKEKEEN